MTLGLRPIIILFGSGELRVQRLDDELLFARLLFSWDGDFIVGTACGLDDIAFASCNCSNIRSTMIRDNYSWEGVQTTVKFSQRTLVPNWWLWIAGLAVRIRRVRKISFRWMPTVDARLLLYCMLADQMLYSVHVLWTIRIRFEGCSFTFFYSKYFLLFVFDFIGSFSPTSFQLSHS